MTVANPNIPSVYEWREEAGGFSPIMTTMDTAPEVILQQCNVAVHKKNKVHNTKMQLQKQQTVVY